MVGGRITSEERSTLSTYIGLGVVTVLAAGAVYFFLVSHQEKKEVTGFDPNRPVPNDATLRRRLKPEQYSVVRENKDQTAFQNEFWDNERVGIYVDVITGEPLFTSLDKFDGGTGRPTFTKPRLPNRSRKISSLKRRTLRGTCSVPRSVPNAAMPTSAISLLTRLRRLDNATP